MTPFLVFDTETTGVDPATARIVELGACHVQDRRLTRYRRRCHPGIAIPVEASAVHGIRDEHVAHEPPFAKVAARFLGLLADKGQGRLVGYNVGSYDVPLLNTELQRAGLPDQLDPAVVLDVLIFVRWHLRHLRPRNLGAICRHFGIDLVDAHSAAADAQATGQLLQLLVARGYIPADFDAALAEQARLAALLDEEWGRWAYWLYRDRRDGRTLRIGCGRHIVRALHELAPQDLRYYVEEIPDLPPDVRRLFEAQCAGRLEAAG